ncbi:intermembrane lipid transfer protein VPS13D-like, partial [Mercenaria mercenaria]|uniref:intermembrane lipid transfer protein VPS13D-like n=1 Tax=Mercenaria mercenaria TaxID=6596 RepID=UPI00234E3EED
GFGKGLYQGVTGIVTKPVAGVLDFASGMSNAVRDASRRSSHMQPSRVRNPRCCHGPGGLLPPYSLSQAESQALLYRLNDHCYEEVFIATELVRGGATDTLHVMITSHQVFFLRILDHHKENIILNIKHGDYTQCRNFEKEGIFMWSFSERGTKEHRHAKNKKQNQQHKSPAQKVAQQINYAKNLFDEKKLSLSVIQDEDEQF